MKETIRINRPAQAAATNDGTLIIRVDEYDELEIVFASDELQYEFLTAVAFAGECRHARDRLSMEAALAPITRRCVLPHDDQCSECRHSFGYHAEDCAANA